MQNHSSHTGYTLVELSIVIIIIGLLTAGGLAVGASMVERAAYIDTRKLIDQLHRTLKDYYIVTGSLPCPARMNVAPGNASFGTETDCTAAPIANATWSHNNARIGAIPTRALGLPDSAAGDKFGNRFVYAVTEGLTVAGSFGSTPGAITVRDMNNNNILTDAAFFIASPGRDRKGAYIHNTGATGDACSPATNLDTLNCTLTSAIFRDAPFNNGDVAARFFDDVTAWAPKFHFMSYDTQSSALWALQPGTQHIFSVGTDGNTATTNVGIGTVTPQEKLQVAGNLQTNTGFLGVGGHGATYMHLSHPNYKDSGQYALLQHGTAGNTYLNSTGTGNLYFRHNNTDRMFIRGADGVVGIGTSTPGAESKLHSTGPIRVDSVDSPLGVGFHMLFRTPTSPAGRRNWALLDANATGNLTFRARGDDWSYLNTTAISMAHATSHVGIGRVNPLTPLHVYGQFDFGSVSCYRGYPGGSCHRNMAMLVESSHGTDGGGIAIITTDDNNDEYILEGWNVHTQSQVFGVKSGGAIHSIPTYNLTNASVPNIRMGNDGIFRRSTHSNSSLRYKKDITPYTGGLQELMKLEPVTYVHKQDDDGVRKTGFIAEDVEAAGLKEFVEYDAEGRPDALQYDRITVLLTKAVQELKNENDALRSEVMALRGTAGGGGRADESVELRIIWLLLFAMLTGGVLAQLLLRRRG